MMAAMVEDWEVIVREGFGLKAAGKMRNLETVSLGTQTREKREYPIMMKKAERVAAPLQYHGVWSFSL